MLSKIHLQLFHIVQQWTNTLGLSCLWSFTNQEAINLHLDLILSLVSATLWPDSRNAKEKLCNSRLVITNWMMRRFLSTETKKLVIVNSPLQQIRNACRQIFCGWHLYLRIAGPWQVISVQAAWLIRSKWAPKWTLPQRMRVPPEIRVEIMTLSTHVIRCSEKLVPMHISLASFWNGCFLWGHRL